jgi:PAS domain S-box-containing protein
MNNSAENTPVNSQYKYDLAAAERCRMLGQTYEAMELYDRAIQGAVENGCIEAEALFNEITAKFYLEIGKKKIAKAYMTDAYLNYARAGDTAKLKYLEQDYADLIFTTQKIADHSEPAMAVSPSIPQVSSSKMLNLVGLMKAFEAIQSEITSDNLPRTLLHILLESVNTKKGCLIFKKEDLLFIEAISYDLDLGDIVLQSKLVETSEDVPISLINYVATTQQPVVIPNLAAENIYQTDPYVQRQQPKSVVCAPILYQGKLIGIFYLENNLATSAFSIANLELLGLLASQAAIAINNARLYACEQHNSRQLQQSLQELQQTQVQLAQQKEQYLSIFEAVNDGIYINDLETGEIVEVNPAVLRIYGYSYEEFLRLSPTDYVHVDSLPLFASYLETLRSGKLFQCHSVNIRKDGTFFDLEVFATTCTYNGKRHGLAILRDISDRKRAELALKQQESQYRSIFESANDGLGICDLETSKFVAMNPAICWMYGYQAEEWLNLEAKDYIHPDSLYLFGEFIEVVKAGQDFAYEAVIIRKDKTLIDVEIRATPYYMHNHKLHGLCIVQDISDRKKAENALRHSETQLAQQKQTLKAILNAAPIWIWMTNLNGKMQFVNKTLCANMGISIGRFIEAEHYREIFCEEITANCIASDNACLAQETPHLSVELLQFVDGKIHKLEVTKTQIKDAQGNAIGIIGLGVDATERAIAQVMLQEKNAHLEQALQELQQAQSQLIQSEKMSALGNLVAGVAHEINNPVGFLNGSIANIEEYIQYIFQHLDCYQRCYPNPLPSIEKSAENIDLEFLIEDFPKIFSSMKVAVDRIRNISTSLRTFSRSDHDRKIACNIHEGIDSTLLILKYRLKANEHRPAIKIIKEYSDLPLIQCFPGQLNQVFMNLVANAIDAIEESNQGMSFAKLKSDDPNTIIVSTEISEDCTSIIIKIKDNGQGIPEVVKERIFDDLFTTKEVGKGTGLGLSISRQIVEEIHGGTLTCDSVLGEGTEFAIALPIEYSN